MPSLEKIAAWKATKYKPYQAMYPCRPPTESSIGRIEQALGIILPATFIEFSRLVPNYGSWFGSIGDDFDSWMHIVELNKTFHEADEDSIALPDEFIMINHGHDGHCDCFDRTKRSTTNEYPIYYLNVESPKEPKLMATTFHDYLEHHA